MKPLAMILVMLALLSLLLSSCATYHSITKTAPITRELLLRLESGKNYAFELKTGQKIKIHIQTISDDRITGFSFRSGDMIPTRDQYYSDTFENVEKYVDKISLRKFNPYLTTLAVVVPVTLGFLAMTFPINFGFNSLP
jgi:hypothetical protein